MMTSFDNICVKQEYFDDCSTYPFQDFWNEYEFAVHDYHEDASTQTDSFTVCKSTLPSQNIEFSTMQTTNLESHCLESSSAKKANHCYKNKSPNTVKVLMEKHRVNERLRHHCLNKQLHMICKIVPGFVDEGKETKVVMMQRIISYIAYLENSIKHLSTELNIQSDPACFLLKKSIKEMNFSGQGPPDWAHANLEDSRDSQVSTLSMSRRLKLSSPTVDSITNSASQESFIMSSSSVTTGPTDSSASDTSIKMETCQADEHFDSIFGGLGFDQSSFQVPAYTFEEGLNDLETSEVEWLGSPDKCLKMVKVENFGIKLDSNFLEESVNEFSNVDVVSPDQVLPQTSIKQKITDSNDNRQYFQRHDTVFEDHPQENEGSILLEGSSCNDECQVVPHLAKRKQQTPKRNPFVNLVNWSEMLVGATDTPIIVEEYKHDPAEIPMASNFMEVESSYERKHNPEESEENPKEALDRIREKVLQDASKLAASSKVDLRKSSWLNGFMMYSRVHRRNFIRKHPGVHTAQISKLMGLAWREMSSEEQQLYRDHAKFCSQELQSVLDSKCTNPNIKQLL